MELIIDGILVLLGILAVGAGWRRGALKTAGAMVGLVAGLIAGLWLAPIAVSWFATFGFATTGERSIVAIATTVIVVAIVAGITTTITSMIARLVRHGPIRAADSLVGSVIGLVAAAAAIWLVAGFAQATGIASVVEATTSSRIVAGLNSLAPVPSSTVLASLEGSFTRAGIPDVFVGGENIVPIAAPDPNVPAAVTATSPSIVRVLASEPSCGTDSEGSGWVVSPGRIVTNAHVVAGASGIVVENQANTQTERATLVAFDPQRDIAVLSVPGLDAPALTQVASTTQAAAGQETFAAGFPENGPFTISPTRVREALVARGTNIYKSGTTTRDIYSLRGIIRPGNSGGPLLDTNGDVVGIVFARSSTNPDTGYALNLDELQPVLAGAGTVAVSSGACASD